MASQTKSQYRTVDRRSQSYTNGPSHHPTNTRSQYRIDTESPDAGRSSQAGCIVHHLFGFGNTTSTKHKNTSKREQHVLKEVAQPKVMPPRMVPVQSFAPSPKVAPQELVRQQKRQQPAPQEDVDEVTV